MSDKVFQIVITTSFNSKDISAKFLEYSNELKIKILSKKNQKILFLKLNISFSLAQKKIFWYFNGFLSIMDNNKYRNL